jgi:PBSX family phage portal protein
LEEKKTMKPAGVGVRIIKADTPVKKSETPSQIVEQGDTISEWLEPPLALAGLKNLVTTSSILPQCIRAYKNNIAGFGIGVRYKNDENDNNKAAAEEFQRATEIIDLLNMDMDTKEVFEDVIETRELYGIAYVEAIRNGLGEVVGIEFIQNTDSIRKTIPLDSYIDVEYPFGDRVEKRQRRFAKYKQTVGQKTVYYRELGDPRHMDKRTGEYHDSVADEHRANEILEFSIGTSTYGEVRWIGQMLGVDGSRKAEELNNRYFKEGRHTPLMIMIKGGTLTDQSFDKLKEYMNDIKGEKGQHAFIVLEAESTESSTAIEAEKQPEIEVKDLAAILQKDELFQDYLDNNRRKVQSSFLLPDLYTGYTADFNRATAQTAMEVTEEQVFQPERVSLAWTVNNKLLSGYRFQYVEAYFKQPNITNPEDLSRILGICERAGGLPPNKAKQIAYNALGETSEDYPDDWGEFPLAYWRSQASLPNNTNASATPVASQLDAQIKKAASGGDDTVVAVMKEVRSLLQNMSEGAMP